MKTTPKIGIRQSWIVWTIMVCITLTGEVYPQMSGSSGRRTGMERSVPMDRTNSRQEAAMEKNQQLQAEATPVIQAMGDQLKELLTLINERRRPDQALLTAAEQAFKDSGRYVRKFDSKIQSEYSMLDSWLKYFKNDIPGAAMSASTAFKNDADNKDARITYTAMSVLSGRRPTGVVAKKETLSTNDRTDRNSAEMRRQMAEQQRGRQRPGETTEQLLNASPATGNILQVDIDALNLDLFEQKVPSIQAQCLNSTSFSYTPGQSALCLLFWQAKPKTFSGATSGSTSGEPNVPGTPSRPGTRNPSTTRRDSMGSGEYLPGMDRGRDRARTRPSDNRVMGMDEYSGMTPGYSMGTASTTTIESETAAVGQLFLAHYSDPGLKFIGVNTDNAAARKEAVAKIVQNPSPWAQVFASDPQNGLGQFAKVDAVTPILAIADKSGTIRYAGPAAGFLAPMILDHLNGIGASGPSASPTFTVTTPATPKPSPSTPASPVTPKPQAAPSVPLSPDTSTMVVSTDEILEPTEEELTENPTLYEAAKKYEYARTLFIPAGQKRFMTSKNGVETCRELLRRWPNTKYAEGARQLLRKVPPDEQKRYNITNEELGL